MAIVDLTGEEMALIREALHYSKRAKRDGPAPKSLTDQSIRTIDSALAKLADAKEQQP
ncbi:hypothetical protein [Lysobacter capsici]|uniref:hypothetical protein n=1 Tax=Lysobacter capsici TaxID=435897 RepID=UPI001C001DA7|nr:hypothetical protein [Lysobacter capsici]QWF15168.1 hypothetical protein KME82_15320 [Lysobacter capsici]